MQTLTKTSSTNKAKTNKLVLGFVGIAATTIIGTAGIAAAQQTRDPNLPNPSSKAACSKFASYGFKNHGQCVSWWEKNHNSSKGHGHGYGGGNNVSTTVNIDSHGSNNVINIVFNYFFG